MIKFLIQSHSSSSPLSSESEVSIKYPWESSVSLMYVKWSCSISSDVSSMLLSAVNEPGSNSNWIKSPVVTCWTFWPAFWLLLAPLTLLSIDLLPFSYGLSCHTFSPVLNWTFLSLWVVTFLFNCVLHCFCQSETKSSNFLSCDTTNLTLALFSFRIFTQSLQPSGIMSALVIFWLWITGPSGCTMGNGPCTFGRIVHWGCCVKFL